MKTLINGVVNTLIFTNSVDDSVANVYGEMQQLGSYGVTALPLTINSKDCLTTSFDVPLSVNQFQNANYVLKIYSSLGVYLFASTVVVTGNYSKDSYLVFESDIETSRNT